MAETYLSHFRVSLLLLPCVCEVQGVSAVWVRLGCGVSVLGGMPRAVHGSLMLIVSSREWLLCLPSCTTTRSRSNSLLAAPEPQLDVQNSHLLPCCEPIKNHQSRNTRQPPLHHLSRATWALLLYWAWPKVDIFLFHSLSSHQRSS